MIKLRKHEEYSSNTTEDDEQEEMPAKEYLGLPQKKPIQSCVQLSMYEKAFRFLKCWLQG